MPLAMQQFLVEGATAFVILLAVGLAFLGLLSLVR
jgi:hypothetical protein